MERRLTPTFVLVLLILLVIGGAPLRAETKEKEKKAKASPTPAKAAEPAAPAKGLHEFQGDDIKLVLRTLAKQAKMNLTVTEDVRGVVNMRLDDMTAREVIDVIVASKELLMEEKNGHFVVRPKNPLLGEVAPPPTAPEKPPEEAWAATFLSSMSKMYDGMLDYQARPETAKKLAHAKKLLYDALIAEGFSKEDALHLLLSNQQFALPDLNK